MESPAAHPTRPSCQAPILGIGTVAANPIGSSIRRRRVGENHTPRRPPRRSPADPSSSLPPPKITVAALTVAVAVVAAVVVAARAAVARHRPRP